MTAIPKRVRSAAHRLGAATLALAVAAALGACGEKDEPDLSTLPAPTETTTQPTPTTPPPTPQGGTGTTTSPAP